MIHDTDQQSNSNGGLLIELTIGCRQECDMINVNITGGIRLVVQLLSWSSCFNQGYFQVRVQYTILGVWFWYVDWEILLTHMIFGMFQWSSGSVSLFTLQFFWTFFFYRLKLFLLCWCHLLFSIVLWICWWVNSFNWRVLWVV